MRARSFRPMFDRLDIRLVLDSGASMVSGSNVAASVLTTSTDTDDSDITSDVDWYTDGNPPGDTYDPTAITTPDDVTD